MSTMASENPYLAGNPVYRGGSNAPTMGTVDPTGYIDRELNNPSQTRSGIAEAALARLKVPNQDPDAAAPTTPLPNPTATINFIISPTGQLIPAPPLPDASDAINPMMQQQPASDPMALKAAILQRLTGGSNG